MEYLQVKEVEVYSLVTLVSNIGGEVGLWYAYPYAPLVPMTPMILWSFQARRLHHESASDRVLLRQVDISPT